MGFGPPQSSKKGFPGPFLKVTTVTLVGMGEDASDVDITDGSTVSAVAFLESHGRSTMDVTIGDETIEHVRIGSDTLVKDAGGNELGSLSLPRPGKTSPRLAGTSS